MIDRTWLADCAAERTKGQLISKGNVGVFKPTKKPTISALASIMGKIKVSIVKGTLLYILNTIRITDKNNLEDSSYIVHTTFLGFDFLVVLNCFL